MKTVKYFLCLLLLGTSSSVIAQSKGEMPFTSSFPNTNKLLRSAWVALADFEIDKANKITRQVLNEDPGCGMAYASLFPSNDEERDENLRKAESMKLSADERMFVEGVKARREKKPTPDYFEPLIKKYPSDYYLHLWVMLNNSEPERALQIGETIIMKKSKFAPAYNLLGYAYMNKNEMAKAETYFDKYLSLRPDLANPYDSKGDFMMRAGKTKEAIALYEKAVSLGMASSEANAEKAKATLRFPKPSNDDASAIREMILTSFEAYKTADVEGILRPYSEQSIEILGNQMANVGLSNLRQRVVSMFKSGSFPRQQITIETINGTGPIAIAYGKTESIWKASESGKESNANDHAMFILRKQSDGNWKIIADHFYEPDPDLGALTAEELEKVDRVLNGWAGLVEPGEPITEKHIEKLSALYSPQAIEIFPGQRSNVGIANLRARWQQFLGARMETNSLGTIAIEGLGRKAVAWGIGNQSIQRKDSEEVVKSQYPWAMILTKEKDDAWRILAIHWGAN